MNTPSNAFAVQIVPPAPFITAPAGSIVSGSNTFTFGPQIAEGGNALLVNGVQHGSGHYLFSLGGQIYTLNALGTYYQWNTSTNNWSQQATKPAGAPV